MAQRFFRPIVLFNDIAPSSSSSSSLKHDSLQQQQQQQQQQQPYISTDAPPLPLPLSQPTQLTVSEHGKGEMSTDDNDLTSTNKNVDMDMDVDSNTQIDQNTTNCSQNTDKTMTDHDVREPEDTNKPVHQCKLASQSIPGALSIDISKKTPKEASPTTSIISPPSSYSSSSSSSMDVLATTLSPARVDMHRKKVQRMLQQNSLLWWELVRYTRNLEKKEREQELEQEKEPWISSSTSSSPSTADPSKVPRVVYHYHHHHHHHNPALPPLHPQQQTSRGRHSLRGRSRRHPYEYSSNNESDYYQSKGRSRLHIEVGDHSGPSPYHRHHRHHHPERGECSEDYRLREARGLAGRNSEPVVVGPSSSTRDRGEYSSISQSPSPRLSPSSPIRPSSTPSFDPPNGTKESSRIYDRLQEPSRQSQYQLSPLPPCCQEPHQSQPYSRETHSRHHSRDFSQSRVHGSMEEYPTATQHTSRERGGSRYDQSNGGNGAFNTPLPPSLTSAGAHSSGPSSGASSPRTRELSSVSTSSYAHSQRYQYQHQHHQHPHQHHNRRDSFPTNQYERSSYHSPSLEVGGWKNGASSSRATEFAPHQHQHHHHHHHQQQQQQQQQSLPLRSSHSFDSLPRPVPVKPASFATPSAASSGAAAASSLGPSTSGPSDNTISTTTSATATTTTTTETNDKGDAHGTDPNRKRRGNLPKTVTSVLKSWLVQNAIHPYPTEEEKMRLSEATQLSMNQISNWFINARRRILQPILVEAAAAAVAGTDAPMDNVLIVRKGKGSRMQVEMECGGSSTQSQNQGQDQDQDQSQGQSQGQGQSQDQNQSQESGAKDPSAS